MQMAFPRVRPLPDKELAVSFYYPNRPKDGINGRSTQLKKHARWNGRRAWNK